MGDRAPLQVYVHECPDEQQAEALRIIRLEYGLVYDWFGSDSPEKDELLQVGECYGDYDQLLGTERELADALIAVAPGATFECWGDPYSPYNGTGIMYAPDLGKFEYRCDFDGRPMFSLEEVTALVLRMTHATSWSPVELGAPWVERIKALCKTCDAAA